MTGGSSLKRMKSAQQKYEEAPQAWLERRRLVATEKQCKRRSLGRDHEAKGTETGITSGRCVDGISRQLEVTDDLRGGLLFFLAFKGCLMICVLVIALAPPFDNPLTK